MDELINKFISEFEYSEVLYFVDISDIERLLDFNRPPHIYFNDAFIVHKQKLNFVPLEMYKEYVNKLYNNRHNIKKFCELYRIGNYDHSLIKTDIEKYINEIVSLIRF